MSTIKIVELVGESDQSWEDAVQNAIQQASKTIDGITGVEVLNMTANVEEGKLVEYKVNLQVAFPVMNR